jgi:hypothetical protein
MLGHSTVSANECPNYYGERGVMVARPLGKVGGAGSIPAAHPNNK